MRIRLEALTESARNASNLTETIKKMSLMTGISPEDLTKTARLLLAQGYSVDQLNQKLKQMSVFAVASGENINEIVAILGRMKTMGFTNIRFMAMLSREGIPMIKAFREYYHLSDKAWGALASRKLSFKLIEPVLSKLTEKGGKFAKSYQEMLKTGQISMKRFHIVLRLISADLADATFQAFGMGGGFSAAVDKLQKMQPEIKKFLANNPELVKMGTYFALILVTLGPMALAIAAVTKVVVALKIAISPVALAIIGIVSAVQALKGISFKGVGKEFAQLFNMIKTGRYREIGLGLTSAMGTAGEQTTLGGGIHSAGSSLFGYMGKQLNGNINVNAPKSIDLKHGNGMITPIPLNVGTSVMWGDI